MKKIASTTILITIPFLILAQKLPLDCSVARKWPSISGEKISSDGRYILYAITSEDSGTVLYIQSTINSFKKEVHNVTYYSFLGDSHRLVFIREKDSLHLFDPSTDAQLYIGQAHIFKLPQEGNGDWLAYQSSTNELWLFNVLTSQKKVYHNVINYTLSDSGNTLLIQTQCSEFNNRNCIKWIPLRGGDTKVIWTASKAGGTAKHFSFDKAETQLAFLIQENDQSQLDNSIFYYKKGMNGAQLLLSKKVPGIEFLIANQQLTFSPNGSKLFFFVMPNNLSEILQTPASDVEIWRYNDNFLYPYQLAKSSMNRHRNYKAVINITDNKVIMMEQENRGWVEVSKQGDGDFALYQTLVNSLEGYRRKTARPDIYLINMKNSSVKCINKESLCTEVHFSYNGKYILWYNSEQSAYFTYNIKTGTIKNISINVPFSLHDELWDMAINPRPYGIATWIENDEGVLVYDRYDIWQLDPEGVTPPTNVTRGYGRKNKTIFRYVYSNGRNYLNEPAIKVTKDILLCAFNEANKDNGFFKKKLKAIHDPEQLTMMPKLFYFSQHLSVAMPSFLLKAKKANIYVAKRMSVTEYPNLHVTSDFVTFRRISDIEPQKKYNWATAELVEWKTFTGETSQGILYKPEDFDSTRKYPIIFSVYERMSAGLNIFMPNLLTQGPFAVEYFVSNGYLVFRPDIRYKLGNPGEGIYSYIVSAAEALCKRSWVDSKRMAIHGHSWGGYEVNLLITKTGLFAAASSAAGASDLVSQSGSILADGMVDAHAFIEQGSFRMGGSIWQKPSTYIENSPIFHVDKVTTPLLLMHNKSDRNVPWTQSIEMFTGLRRLNKKTWLLQYNNSDHELYGSDAVDYTRRLSEFFDHYLKGNSAPQWMENDAPGQSQSHSPDLLQQQR